jgi:glycosyltransferase involved in cell wall biosynthesis
MPRSPMNPVGTETFDDVSVVMITRNEEQAIATVVGDCQASLPGAEIVVVDGSDDATPEIATRLGALVIREPGGGPAPALMAALKTPTRPIVATIDADATYPTGVFPKLVDLVRGGVDVAGTDRLGTRPPKTMPLQNWLANVAFGVLASARARRRLRDPHSGQRVYNGAVIDRLDWDAKGLAFPVDLLFWPGYAGCRIEEITIPYHERIGETTLSRWPSGRETLRRLSRKPSEMRERCGWRSFR